MKASNSLLNYHKTQAFSLSGSPLSDWQDHLSTQGITQWHDRSSPTPLIYLGYPICSSITQRNMAYSKLYDDIKACCHIHSQRSLSIRGRATVLNSLIYSKLWHVLRLTIFTQSQLNSFRSIGSLFINHRIFPRLSFSTLTLPRQQGGVGLLDPAIQQHALQWRWAGPLLLSETNPSSNNLQPSLPLLRYTFNYLYSSPMFPTYRYFLLFPHVRYSHWSPNSPSGKVSSFLNITCNIIKDIDLIPRSFDSCSVNQFTCLSLPLLEIVSHSIPSSHPSASTFVPPDQLIKDHPGLKKLLVQDVFVFIIETQTLRLRESRSEFFRHPTLSYFAAQLIRSHQFLLQPFFYNQCLLSTRMIPSAENNLFKINLQSFCNRIVTHHLPSQSTASLRSYRSKAAIPIFSNRYYKSLLPILQSTTSSLLPKHWKQFWRLDIPLQARTVWYRCIHNKIPTKKLLHHILPSIHPTPHCPVCSSLTTDGKCHFLFSYPTKLEVWQKIFSTYVRSQQPTSPFPYLSKLLNLSSSLSREDHPPLPDLTID
jgi:hypothetical protein